MPQETMPQDYTITAVNRAFDDADKHGNVTWNVKIDGETKTALLKTRPENRPQEGDVIFGHFEPTQSKKATWLKKDLREGGGNFQNSRPAQPAAQPAAQPSSNGEPSLSFEETKAKAEEKRAKAIHDSVVFKGAVDMWVAQPNDSLGKIAVRARALMQLCECVDIPQDNEPVLSEEPPF